MNNNEEKSTKTETDILIKYKKSPNKETPIWKDTFLGNYLRLETNKLMKLGLKIPLDFENLFQIQEIFKFQKSHKKISRLYTEEKAKNSKKNLYEISNKIVKKKIFVFDLIKWVINIFQIPIPLMIKWLLEWLEDANAPWWEGYLYALFLAFGAYLLPLTEPAADAKVLMAEREIVNGFQGMILKRVEEMPAGSQSFFNAGMVSNLITGDLTSLVSAFHIAVYIPIGFMLVITSSIIAIYEVGYLGLILPLCSTIVAIIQYNLNKSISKWRKKKSKTGDKRAKLVTDTISGIKMIKFNTWEKIMIEKSEKFRKEEKNLMKNLFNSTGFLECFGNFLPIVSAIATFWLYSVIYGDENQLSIPKTYSLITIFNSVIEPIRHGIFGYIAVTNSKVAAGRIEKLLMVGEREKIDDDKSLRVGEIKLEKASFTWVNDEVRKLYSEGKNEKSENLKKNETLENINLKISPGEFIAIVGKVGSGKSSVLHAIMNEMVKTSGTSVKNGKIAFIPQEAFLINETLKNNIIFGLKFNEEKYKKSLKLAELEQDIEILPGKDYTQIGERGINLSGGQKQRISIARAYYSNADIYVIDDALSALDAEVGKKIMENLFKNELRGKTRILVTHKLKFLRDVDKVVLMKNGEIVQFGDFDFVKESDDYRVFSESREEKANEKENEEVGKKNYFFDEKNYERETERLLTERVRPSKSGKIQNKILEDEEINPESSNNNNNKIQIETERKNLIKNPKNEETIEEKLKKGKLNKEEKSKKGFVNSSSLSFYIKNCGILKSSFTLFLYIIALLAKIVSDWWVGKWMSDSYNFKNKNNYTLIYLLLSLTIFIAFILRTYSFSDTISSGALKIFKDLFKNILRRPLSFFDTTPSGQIMNRCIGDIHDVDLLIPDIGQFFLIVISSFVGCFIVLIFVSPLHLIIILVFLLVSFKGVKNYVKVSTEMKRMIKLSSSPLMSIAGEMINGAVVIRQYGIEDYLWEKFTDYADLVNITTVHERLAVVWLHVRVKHLTFLIIALSTFAVPVNKNFQIILIDDVSSVGIMLSYVVMLTLITTLFVWASSALYSSFSSIERLQEYIAFDEHERDWDHPKAPENWPKSGKIEGRNVRIRYRENLPLVLNGLDFSVKENEKVGVVGRTGSGKSTLLLSLMRVVEMAENEEKSGKEESWIKIDGVDISKIGLHELRRNLIIIPQDPFLLEGSLEFNIDPLGEYGKDEIVNALKKLDFFSTLKKEDLIHQFKEEKIQNLKKDEYFEKNSNSKEIKLEEFLEYKISSNGTNLSLGQRQLICIARALIRSPKILLMDEATANIDQKTDEIIQRVISHEMPSTTVITIAHRLNTIIQYDRIIVMKNGAKFEEGRPVELMKKRDGEFRKLVEEGGKEFRDLMLKMAMEKEEKGGS